MQVHRGAAKQRRRVSARARRAGVAILGFAACRDFDAPIVPLFHGDSSADVAGAGGDPGATPESGGHADRDTFTSGSTTSAGRGSATRAKGGHGGGAGRSSEEPPGVEAPSAPGAAGAAAGAPAGSAGEGEAGAAVGALPGAPGALGAVRIFVNGEARCAGTLLTNSWVLTADHCIPWDAEPAAVSIRLGGNAVHYEQARSGLELQRFPGNTEQGRVRDLALVGVDAPFAIDGSTTTHYFPLALESGWGVLQPYTCVAWDLDPSPGSPTDTLQSIVVTPVVFSTEGLNTFVWWENSDLVEPSQGKLLTANDGGAGCFLVDGGTPRLAAVHVGNPELRRDGTPNAGQEAYSLSLGARDIHEWLGQVLFGTLPDQHLELTGAPVACAPGPREVDLFGLEADGRVGWYRRAAGDDDWRLPSLAWVEQPPLDPPAGVVLAPERLGTLCLTDGSIELVAAGLDGGLWWQHRGPGGTGWADAWVRVPAATSGTEAPSGGVSLVGNAPGKFHAYAVFDDGAIHHLRYDEGWTGTSEAYGDDFVGTPSARLANAEWLDVFARTADGALWDLYAWFTPPQLAYYFTEDAADNTVRYPSDPAVASWKPTRIDVFGRSGASRITRLVYDVYWSAWLLDVGLDFPAGELAAATREPAAVDLFVLARDGSLRHASWPRLPAR